MEWSDWIQHNGTGCPLPAGTYMRVRFASGNEFEGQSVVGDHPAWWGGGYDPTVVAYRYLRESDGLVIDRADHLERCPLTLPLRRACRPQTHARGSGMVRGRVTR